MSAPLPPPAGVMFDLHLVPASSEAVNLMQGRSALVYNGQVRLTIHIPNNKLMSSRGSLELENIYTSPESVEALGLDRHQEHDGRARKKQKVSRSKTACLQCRSRRSRCGALPPGACPTCVTHGLVCEWPVEGSRRRRGRPRTNHRSGDDITLTEPPDGSETQNTSHYRQRAVPSHAAHESPCPAGRFSARDLDFPSGAFDHDQDIRPAQESSDMMGDGYMQDCQDVAATQAAPSTVMTINRYHGRTGMSPGTESVAVDITVPLPNQDPRLNIDDRTLPSPAIIGHILDLFFKHFTCRYPFLIRSDLHERNPYFPFLLHSMGSLVARFSDHPEICGTSQLPQSFGLVFRQQAMLHLRNVMSIASRETIGGLLILAESTFGDEKHTDMWMLIGMAVRLTMDSSLHMSSAGRPDVDPRELRLNRLMFWTVIITDYTVCLKEGRPTSISPEDVTQELPIEDDIAALSEGAPQLRSPFPFAAEMIFGFGRAISLLNRNPMQSDNDQNDAAAIQQMRARCAAQYDELPLDIMWNAANLQKHHRAGQGSMYLFLHLWNHTIQSTKFLYSPGIELEDNSNFGPTGKTDSLTLQSIQAGSWLHCARFAADMLVLADVFDPNLYLTTPSLSYCFLTAARCFLNDLDARSEDSGVDRTPDFDAPNSQARAVNRSKALFKAIALDNVKILQHGLSRQTVYWNGLKRVLANLEARLEALLHPRPIQRFNAVPIIDRSHIFNGVEGLNSNTTGHVFGDTGYYFNLPTSSNSQTLDLNLRPAPSLDAGISDPAIIPPVQPSAEWNWLYSIEESPSLDILQLLGLDKN